MVIYVVENYVKYNFYFQDDFLYHYFYLFVNYIFYPNFSNINNTKYP